MKPRKPTWPKIRPNRRNMRMLRILRKTGIKTPDVKPSLAGFLASSGGGPWPRGSEDCGIVATKRCGKVATYGGGGVGIAELHVVWGTS